MRLESGRNVNARDNVCDYNELIFSGRALGNFLDIMFTPGLRKLGCPFLILKLKSNIMLF